MKFDFTKNEDYPVSLPGNIFLAGNYYFNTYIVKGSRDCAIIETGVSATVDSLISQLESLEITPSYIIVTHPHSDHISGLIGLKERYPHAKVIIGSGAKEFVEHHRAAEVMFTEDSNLSKALDNRGVKPGRPSIARIPDLSGSTFVDGSYKIDLGGNEIHCISVKGHSPGNIVVHAPLAGYLFPSDSLGFHYPRRGFCPLFFTGFYDYVKTIKFLESLKPEALGLAHQGPILKESVHEAFEQAFDAAFDVFKKVSQSNEDDIKIAEELFNKYYVDEFTVNSEKNIMNCMNLLVRRSREYAEYEQDKL